jgi:hypothetical protein
MTRFILVSLVRGSIIQQFKHRLIVVGFGGCGGHGCQGGYMRDDSTADGRGFTQMEEGKDPSFEKMQVGMS